MAHQQGTFVNLHNLPSGSGSMRPIQDDGHNGPSHSLPSLRNPVFNADHVMVAAENGVVYVIWQDPSTTRTTVWMHSTGTGGFIKASDSILFRRTSKPFISSNNTLYVGGKKLPGQKPAVYVWKANKLFGSLESPRPAATNWEYTVLAQSSTGRILYCGCSDGAIEVWNYVDSNQPRVYDHHLAGHGGGIHALAVGNDGILISVDKQDLHIVRVWRTQQQVVKLDLKLLEVSRLACTMEGNLYIITRGERPTRMWCNVKNLVDLAAARRQVRPVHGLEVFSKLQDPSTGPTAAYHAMSCFVAHGASGTVYFLSIRPLSKTYVVEEWRGNEFVSKVDTGLREFRSWTVSRNGTMYFSSTSTGQISRWRLHSSSVQMPWRFH